MIYKIVGDTEENLIAFLPESYLEDWRNDFCHIAIAQDEQNHVVGVVIFSLLDNMEQKLVLKYVQIDEAYRERKVATILIQKTLDLLAVKGYKRVRCLVYKEKDKVNAESFLCALGFSKTDEFAVQISSELGKFKSSNLYKQVSAHIELMSHVRGYDDVSYDQIEEFKRILMEQQGIHIKSSLDEEYTCFFVQDNRIIAASDFRVTSQDEIVRNFIYALEGAERKYIFPTMIVYIVNKALENLTETACIQLNVFEKSEHHGILKTLGDYVAETPIAIYEREV